MVEKSNRKENWAALPLVAPFVLIYLSLFIYPSLQMLATSFTDSALTKTGVWVGFDNYVKLFRDRYFGAALANTLYFVTLTVVPSTLIGLALAMIVNRLTGIFQFFALSIFFLPYVLPVSTVTAIANMLTNTTNGPLGGLAQAANGTVIPVWSSAAWFMPSVAVLTIWWTVGFSVLIYIAGLRTIPRDIYEAGQLHGASSLAEFWFLTWPLMKPITGLVLVIQLIFQIRVFDQVYLLAAQASSRSATVLVHYIYSVAFQRNQAGYASTIAVVYFVIGISLVTIVYQLLRVRSTK